MKKEPSIRKRRLSQKQDDFTFPVIIPVVQSLKFKYNFRFLSGDKIHTSILYLILVAAIFTSP